MDDACELLTEAVVTVSDQSERVEQLEVPHGVCYQGERSGVTVLLDFLDVTLACDDDEQFQAHKVVSLARAGVHGQMICL